ncbi:ATP-binding cassette domain-containing protein [Aristophania vespae]|uniref:ATP-binding cassette domain-containing protein n=1 Tax=Aristophania vespae TaxID=2697033 RepID=A0A6P1NE79_9PROT|nr:ATP-binding cassette domain-containing protein [Aristophania vespae]QHI95819.1 ATP-binding cassette domain-containing protein [Aristophania vespae]UMM63531.1 Methionine import ATP-binding protein MetN [Aristophania vespae]
MIELHNLTLPISRDYHPQNQQTLSLRLEIGSHYWLLGPPESGKTSLLEILALQRSFSKGTFNLFGNDISKKMPSKTLSFLRSRISYIADNPEFIEEWTIFDNIALPLRLNQYDRKTIIHDTTTILRWLSLDKDAQSYPKTLSHTALLKASIARALINRPALLLIDKLALTINQYVQDKLITILKEIIATGKTTVVIATETSDLVHLLPGPIIHLPAQFPDTGSPFKSLRTPVSSKRSRWF